MINTAQVTVGVTATELTVGSGYRDEGYTISVKAPAGVSLFIGDDTVTTATGWEMAAGSTMTLTLKSSDRLYGVVAAATQVVTVLRVGV